MIKEKYCSFFGAFGTVYTLANKNNNVFYIGCTLYDLKKRLSVHIWEAKNSRNGKSKKCDMVRLLNYEVIITGIDRVWVTSFNAHGAAQKLEIFEKEWIEKYRLQGIDLCNK